MIKDKNIQPGTLYMTEQKVGNNFELIVMGEDFMNRIPRVHTQRAIINKKRLLSYLIVSIP